MALLKIEATIFDDNGNVIKKEHVFTVTRDTAQECQETVEVIENFCGNL